MLRFHATRHQRTLCSMKAANGSTSYGDEHAGENGTACYKALGAQQRCGLIQIACREIAPQLWDGRHLYKEYYQKCKSHEYQSKSKQRIKFAYQFVDRKHRGKNIIQENQQHPCQGVETEVFQQQGRTIHKHSTYHEKQEDRENQHDLFHTITQKHTYQLGQTRTIETHAQHA